LFIKIQRLFVLPGKFAYENASGFVVSCIDLDDTTKQCECGTQYPAFEALLNGFNYSHRNYTCDKLNRIPTATTQIKINSIEKNP